MISNGKAKLGALPPHAERRIKTHDGQVRRVNFDEGERVLNNIIIIAPLLTSLVALGTLWNVSRQRIISNRPDIHFKPKDIIIKFDEKDKLPYVESKNDDSLESAIFNIGLGTAKNIKAKWVIDEKNFDKLKEFDDKDEYIFEKISGGDRMFYSIKKIRSNEEAMVRLSYTHDFDFILPYKTNEEPEEFLEPSASIRYIYGIYSELLFNRLEEGQDLDLEEDFNCRLEISYQDISGKKYNDIFKMKLEYKHLGSHGANAYYQLVKI
ncbi:XtrA/YqaO family protein [Planococcus citreus]|uniref:XtrA/YqaO family protein n=1 Tax=Planococcus citreus TaxID=1373 RepID=UPI001F4F815D|nr:XtrA/YqaO family protein [Planococcus citreus]